VGESEKMYGRCALQQQQDAPRDYIFPRHHDAILLPKNKKKPG